MMRKEAVEITSLAGAQATVVGAALNGWGWLLSNEFFGFMGVLIAVCGLLMQQHYKRKSDMRQAKESAWRERESALRERESQIRIDLMIATGMPIKPPLAPDSQPAELDE